MSKTKSIVISILLAIVTVTVAVFTFANFNLKGTKKYVSIFSSIEVGAELDGAYRINYNPIADEGEVSKEDLQKSISIIRNRLNLEAFSSAVVYQRGNGFAIEYPKSTNFSAAKDYFYRKGVVGLMVDSTDWFEYDTQEFSSNPYISKATVSEAYSSEGILVSTSGYSVVLHFTSSGRERFKQATAAASASSNSKVEVVLDGDATLSSASVSETIDSDSVQISGNFTKAQAEIVASVINNGVLPVEFFNGTVVGGEEIEGEEFSIDAVFGKNTFKKVVIAFVVAVIVLMILLGVFYRGFGIVADLSMILTAILFVLIYSIIPGSAFTAASVIGIICSVGLFTVISVMLFESVKKEFENGKTVNFAISSGFKKCITIVIDVAVLCLIAYFGSFFIVKWAIRSFFSAFAIAGLLSCFTSSVLTRGLMLLFKPLFNQARFYNLNREETDND